MEKQYKVISFDLFQTLVNVNENIFKIWDTVLPNQCTQEQANQYANELFVDYATIMRHEMIKSKFITMKEIFYKCAKSTINRLNIAVSPESLVKSLVQAHYEAPFYEDAIRVIKYLKKNYKIVISTDADDDMVCIERMNDLGVDKIYTSEMLKKYKSDTGKKFLLSVLNDFKIEKQESLHIGDSDSDLVAAVSLDVDFILLDRKGTKRKVNSNAECIINRLDDLREKL